MVWERCKLPSRVQGGAPAAKGFSRILNIHDDLSGQQDYGPRRFYFFGFLAEWQGPRYRAQTKMAGPRPCLVYS